MEQGLAKSDAEAFREAISASKGHVCSLIEEIAEAEGIYNAGEARFDSILTSVAKEIKAFVCQEGEKQRKEYKKQSLAQIKRDHGRLDGTCFIPMIISNLSAHRALATSQRVAHSHVPLKIMSAPLRTQAGAVKVYLKFVEFLAGRVIALQERLGPNTTTVPLESEPGQSISPTRRRSSSPSPARKPSHPPKCGSPVSSKHGSPAASQAWLSSTDRSCEEGANANRCRRRCLQPAIPECLQAVGRFAPVLTRMWRIRFTNDEGKGQVSDSTASARKTFPP